MACPPSFEELGDPALKIAGFQLWVHGREFPDATDSDDGNWLRVTAHCGASGASVWVYGPILEVTGIDAFRKQCESLWRGDGNSALLDSHEPNLRVAIEPIDQLGHLGAEVKITPDHMTQSHSLRFEIDQSYLPGIATQCAQLLATYPIPGAR